MNKEDVIRIITSAAKKFHENLENKNLLFISGTPDKPIFTETVFLPRNFLHFTGVKVDMSSTYFLKQCLNKKLSKNDFSMDSDGNSEKKLKVISSLMNIHENAREIGNYNGFGKSLYTERIVGKGDSKVGCMGFVYDNDNDLFISNTVLNKTVKEATLYPREEVIAVLRKPIKQEKYTELCYMAEGIQLNNIELPNDFSEKIATNSIEKEIFQQNRQPSDQIQSAESKIQDTIVSSSSTEKNYEKEKNVTDVRVDARDLNGDNKNQEYRYMKHQKENGVELLDANNSLGHANETILGLESKTKPNITLDSMKGDKAKKIKADMAKQNEGTRTEDEKQRNTKEKAHQALEDSTPSKPSGGGGNGGGPDDR